MDTGTAHLVFPKAWSSRLGNLDLIREIDCETANQDLVKGEICGPVEIKIEGFDPIYSEILFLNLIKIIYTLLKACENTHQRQISSNGDKFKEVFHSQLHSIFQIHHPKALARLGAKRAEVLIDYANTHFHIQTGMDDFSILI